MKNQKNKRKVVDVLANEIVEAYNIGVDDLLSTSILCAIINDLSKSLKNIDLTNQERVSIILTIVNEYYAGEK